MTSLRLARLTSTDQPDIEISLLIPFDSSRAKDALMLVMGILVHLLTTRINRRESGGGDVNDERSSGSVCMTRQMFR